MFRFRLAPLRMAALLVVGFIAIRLGYRVAFGGASGGGIVLLELPRVPLAAPFSHIALFGTITTGGLANATLSALPFAAVILCFGLLNALVDISRLFARGAGRGPLRAVSRALVISWATFPALIESVRRVRVAGALRGERSIGALLIPVFEQTVERALALAASMESRGFASTRPVDGVCERPVVMTDAALDFDGDWHLEHLDVTLMPGTLSMIVGPTGSGKSSLLHSLGGLFQHFSDGTQRGLIEVAGVDRASTPPRDTAGFVGLVPQNVRLSFAAETVHDEIGFVLAVRGVSPVIVQQRVREVAAQLGIGHLLSRPIGALSAGEATLVAIGSAIISRPILLLVDEPLADLDTAARLRVCRVLDELAHEARLCVVVAEHNTREWRQIADAWLEIRDHRVQTRAADGHETGHAVAGPAAAAAGRAVELGAHGAVDAGTEPLAGIRHLTVLHGTHRAVDDVSIDIVAGEIIALVGSNGAGKSSLLEAIALPEARGSVVVAGRDVSTLRPRTRRTSVALVPENVDDLLFAGTVAEECRRADHRAGHRALPPGGATTASTFAGFLGIESAEVAPLMLRHPRDLSAGERLCLVMAIQLAAAPALLLVDEPTRGLDSQARALVGTALLRASGRASAVVFATHDDEFARRLATRTIVMESGRVAAAEPVVAP